MPYVIEWEEKGLYCKFYGRVTGAELIQCNKDIYGDERFDEIRFQLFDMLAIIKLDIGPKDVRIVAACDNAAALTNPKVKCALVAKDENAHILSRLYQNGIKDSPWEGRSFKNISDAREWLS